MNERFGTGIAMDYVLVSMRIRKAYPGVHSIGGISPHSSVKIEWTEGATIVRHKHQDGIALDLLRAQKVSQLTHVSVYVLDHRRRSPGRPS